MSCNCPKTKRIPCCMDTLTIGSINDLSQAVKVYFDNITTGGTVVLLGLSDGAGLVTVDVTDQQFASNQSYEIWVTLASGNMNDRKDITIGSEVVECLQAEFFKVKTEEGTIDVITDFIIEMA